MLERICGRKPGFFAAFTKEIKDFFFNSSGKQNCATVSFKIEKLRHTPGNLHRETTMAKAHLLSCVISLLQWEQHCKKHFSSHSTIASNF